MHDASPPNVVGPSSSASVDALNATVVPSGTAATPARIVNVSAHDAPGEQTIPHDQLAWHRVASPSVGAPPAHVNVGAAHEDVANALARASAPTLDARSAVTTTIARDIGVRDNASRSDDDDDARDDDARRVDASTADDEEKSPATDRARPVVGDVDVGVGARRRDRAR